jgi:hypothetical protein
LSFFIVTSPLAAGATDEVKKLMLVTHELNENRIINAKIPKEIFFTGLFNLIAFMMFYNYKNE